MPHRGEHALDRIRGAQMNPMLGGEVEEREQRLTILDRALDRGPVFGTVFLDEGVDRGFGFRPARCQIDVPQIVLHRALDGFGDLVEHVADFVAPCACPAIILATRHHRYETAP
jgi:hypothetical protein